jgi:uridine kinase
MRKLRADLRKAENSVSHGRPHLVGIAGASCSGKTALARHLAGALSATLLQLDSYYHDLSRIAPDARARVNFDKPDALDHDLFHEQLTSLSMGHAIEKPIYDFATHSRTGETELVRPAEFIVIEGLFILWWQDIRSLLDTRIYVDLEDKLCLERRISRDTVERGRTPESVRLQYIETVRPMALQYVLPSRQFAHVVVPGDIPKGRALTRVLVQMQRQAESQTSRMP